MAEETTLKTLCRDFAKPSVHSMVITNLLKQNQLSFYSLYIDRQELKLIEKSETDTTETRYKASSNVIFRNNNAVTDPKFETQLCEKLKQISKDLEAKKAQAFEKGRE